MKIQSSVALVTGANRGIGLVFVKALLERGASKVYAAARDPESMTNSEIGKLPRVVPVRLDVTRSEQIAALVRDAGDVSILVNNAGISAGSGALATNALEAARREIETNYIGPLAMSQAFAPVLARQGGGAIVNVLSALSWVTLPRTATYSASKAAAWALTNGLRTELRGQGTQVVAVHSGFVDTDMVRAVSAPKVSPADVVRRTLDGLEAGEHEVLADDVSRSVKGALSSGVYLRDREG